MILYLINLYSWILKKPHMMHYVKDLLKLDIVNTNNYNFIIIVIITNCYNILIDNND